MSDFEFLEPDGAAAPVDEPARGATARVPGWLAPLLALAGGVLAVVAPFAVAFRATASGSSDVDLDAFGYDGWGRFLTPDSNQHAARTGIVYCVAAGFVLAGIVLWLGKWHRRDRWRLAGSGVILLAAGAVLSAGALALLNATATKDSIEMALGRSDVLDDSTSSRPPSVTLHLGGLIWWSLASAVLLVVAVVLRTLTTDRATELVAEPVAEVPGTPTPPHRDDEFLER